MEELIDLYGDNLYRLCFAILCDRYDAEDALQETFLRYIRKKPVFESREHEKAWLTRVAANVCKDMRRFSFRHPVAELDESLEFVQKEENRELLESILSLPVRLRVVIELYYVEGYSVEEAAHILNISSSAVKMRLQRGRETLRVDLSEGRGGFGSQSNPGSL